MGIVLGGCYLRGIGGELKFGRVLGRTEVREAGPAKAGGIGSCLRFLRCVVQSFHYLLVQTSSR